MAKIGPYCNIFGNPIIGNNTTIGAYTEIGPNVSVGNSCKIQAFVFIPHGVTIGDNVFIGPRVTFCNVKNPGVNVPPIFLSTIVEDNVSIGAGAIILPGIVLRKGCRIGAGAVVTKDVMENQLVKGNPAK